MPRKVLKRQHNDTCALGTEDTQFSLEQLIHRKSGGCHDHTLSLDGLLNFKLLEDTLHPTVVYADQERKKLGMQLIRYVS